MSILLPDINHIIQLHDRIILATGGVEGLRSPDALASAWSRAEAIRFYDKGASTYEVAAGLCVSIAKAHAFVDGNKRAAYGALNLTLQMNSLKIEAQSDEVVDVIVSNASGNGRMEKLAAWLSVHCVADPVYQALFDFDARGPDPS